MSGEIYLDGTVTPTSAAPIANDTDLKGGFRVVADAAARNAIPTERRTKWMQVAQVDTGVVYVLSVNPPYAFTNADWSVAGSSLLDTYANRPASGTNGQIFRPSDGGPSFIWDAGVSLWRPQFETTLGFEPPSAGWTAIDGGAGAAVSFSKGTVELASTSVSSSNQIALAVRTFDGSGDFDVIAKIRPILSLRNSSGGLGTFVSGLCLRDSGTANFMWFLMQANSAKTKQIQVSAFTDANTFSYDLVVQDATQWFDDADLWLRVTDTSGTRRFYVSNDGLRWWEIAVQTGGSRFPVSFDQIGLAHQGYVFSGSASWDSGVRLESLETSP